MNTSALKLWNFLARQLRKIFQQVLADSAPDLVIAVLEAAVPGHRPLGFITVTPCDRFGNSIGGQVTLGASHIVGVTTAWVPRDVTLQDLEQGMSKRRSKALLAKIQQKRRANQRLAIGTRLRLATGKELVVQEYYQRVLWLLYRARSSACPVSYVHNRDKLEFATWAHDYLGWQRPDWLDALDDCNYSPIYEEPVEEVGSDGLVTFSDGSKGIPSTDGATVYWRPKVLLDDEGDPTFF